MISLMEDVGQTVTLGVGLAGVTNSATSIPDFSRVWIHQAFPWFEPPASGSGPVTNKSRWAQQLGILFFALIFAHQAFAEEPKRVLLLYHPFATNLVYAKNIRAQLDQQFHDALEIYDAVLLPASNEIMEDRYADYLHSRFRDQRLDVVVGIGSDAVSLFRRYRHQVFPSTAMLALMEERRISTSDLAANDTAIGSSTNFAAIVEKYPTSAPGHRQCRRSNRQFPRRKVLVGTNAPCIRPIRNPCIVYVVKQIVA
jgi:hypothetical protein